MYIMTDNVLNERESDITKYHERVFRLFEVTRFQHVRSARFWLILVFGLDRHY